MSNSLFFSIATASYFFAVIGYFYHAMSESTVGKKAAYLITIIGILSHTIAMVLQYMDYGFAAFTGTYGSISLWAWLIVAAYLILDWVYDLSKLGTAILPIAFAFMAVASSPLVPSEVTPLVPALQSYWLTSHITFSFVGYAFFAIGAGASVLYLVNTIFGLTTFSSERLDQISYKAISIGFPIFTLGGLIFGAIWAQTAWGRYWGWDPKEVWTLITWIVFAIYLHTRLTHGWKGKRSALIAVIGFFSALFTYFGVNWILSGLHSYAG